MDKAIIYARVSSEEQAKCGFSIENQKKTCSEFAERNGYYIDKLFVEEGKSAKNLDRPEIQDLLSYCSKKRNDIKAVIVWRLDRISRSNEDYHGALKPLFEKMGITLLSATEANVNTIEGDLMRNIGMSFAEYERKVIGVRTVAGLEQKAEQGEFPHSAPIGYKNEITETGAKIIVIDEKTAMYVRRAFELYDSGLYSLRSLTEQLYKDGFRNKKGQKVSKTVIDYMLKNIFYTGVFKYKGKIFENSKHKAIITKELFYRVQNRLVDPNKSKQHNIKFAYTDLIRCEHCGCLLTAEIKKGKYVYYHCTGNKGGNCKKDWIREETIDKGISEILKRVIIPQQQRMDISKSLKLLHEQKNGYSKEVKANINRQIGILESRLEKLFIGRLDGTITLEDEQKYNKKWHEEKDKLLIQLEEINKIDKEFHSKIDNLLAFTDNAYEYYLSGNIEQRKKIIEIISNKISYKDKNLNIELKPIFNTIVENQYILQQKTDNNRTLETGTKKELEPNSTSCVIKNSPKNC